MPRFARNSISPVGGTVVTEKTRSWPIIAIVIGVVVVVFIGWQVKKAFEDYRTNVHHVRDAGVLTVEPPTAPVPDSLNESLAAGQTQTPASAAPKLHAEDVAKTLEHNLKNQRLWSTVTVTGDHVDVRSASCADGAMKPAIEIVAASFHAAGLTKLRCVEQSGGVVFSRDL
ncbi:MAG: hypothetical protein ABI591_12290 [Kofleriaceae bacterium]